MEDEKKENVGDKCDCGHFQLDHHVEAVTDMDLGYVKQEWKKCLACNCSEFVRVKKKWEFWR